MYCFFCTAANDSVCFLSVAAAVDVHSVQTWYSTAPLGEIQDCFLRLGEVAKATSTEEADRIFADIVSDLKELTGDVEGMGKYMILVRLCLHCSQP